TSEAYSFTRATTAACCRSTRTRSASAAEPRPGGRLSRQRPAQWLVSREWNIGGRKRDDVEVRVAGPRARPLLARPRPNLAPGTLIGSRPRTAARRPNRTRVAMDSL